VNTARISSEGDSGGVIVRYTDQRPRLNVGIVSLHVHGVLVGPVS
jgi:hypothetical protein